MTISEVFQDSASISTTEYFLASDSTTATYQTTDGVYMLYLDLSNLAKGDSFTIKAYEKVASGGTARKFAEWTVANAQGDGHWVSPSLVFMHGWEFSITRTAGSDRTIAWSIRQVA